MKGCKLEDKSTSARKTYKPGKKKKSSVENMPDLLTIHYYLALLSEICSLFPPTIMLFKKKRGKNYTSLCFLKT